MTIRAKLITANILIFGFILLSVAAIVYDRTYESEMTKIDTRLDSYATSIGDEFEEQRMLREFPDSNELVPSDAFGLIDVQLQIIDTSGLIIYDRGSLPSLTSKQLKEVTKQSYVLRQIITIGDSRFRYTVRQVEDESRLRLTVAMASSMSEIDDRLNDLTVVLIVTIAIALFLSAFAVFFVVGRAFRPLSKMIVTAEKISASSLHRRIGLPSERNEVWSLANAFNEMMQRIEEAFESQRQFVADASHELRTPLTIIYCELEFLRKQVDNERLKEGIDTSLHEIDGLAHLVQQLLILVRIDSQAPAQKTHALRLDELLVDIARLFQSWAKKRHISLNIYIEEAVTISGVADDLKRALINLVDNAVKYSPDGGTVEIQLRNEAKDAVVTIRDSGCGFDSLARENAFKRFYRSPEVRHSHEGNGLGLSIAKEHICAQGGAIELSNSESGGAQVVVRFSRYNPSNLSMDPKNDY